MKIFLSVPALFWGLCPSFGQASGNANYQTQIRLPDAHIQVSPPSDEGLVITVKGMANVKADAYVAIFSVAQAGKTAEEANTLMDTRTSALLDQLKARAGVSTYVDMVSFVPMYEYEAEKKIFSKQTYNEVPAGFEVKKNIHVKFTNAADLHYIVMLMSKSEIYDLVRVDYFSTDMEAVKKDLMAKAKTSLQEKLKIYQPLLGNKPDSANRQVSDGFRVVLPTEMYKTCQAFSSTSIGVKKSANLNQADKSTTLYYQPVLDKEFDFVINPVILEPVIQVMYEVVWRIDTKKAASKTSAKEIMLVTPNGDLKPLSLK